MANHNGRTHTEDNNTEHGYQDWRDQRDREHGRDDFRGLDRTGGDRSRSMRDDNRFGDRYNAGSSWGGNRDQFAERDRNMYGDRDESNYRGQGGSMERGASDYQRGSGYGYSDGDMRREQMSYRGGQSGSQAGGASSYGSQNYQGGNRGQWGDFDRGGRSGHGGSGSYDSMSPRDRNGGEYHGGSAYGSSSYGQRNYGEQSWGRDQQNEMRGPHAGKGPQGFQRSDERIKEMVHEALTDHEHLDATHITVDVKQGEVTLTGSVEDRAAKRMAEDCAENVKGVKDVQNQLRVGASSLVTTSQADKKNRPS